MCNTALLSRDIIKLSKRSFSHRIETALPNCVYKSAQLSRLNKDLNNLYELIYDEFPTITEDDYKVFGSQLTILIDTIKVLLTECKKNSYLAKQTIRLESNYLNFVEINNDIVNFKIKLPKNQKVHKLMAKASELMKI